MRLPRRKYQVVWRLRGWQSLDGEFHLSDSPHENGGRYFTKRAAEDRARLYRWVATSKNMLVDAWVEVR